MGQCTKAQGACPSIHPSIYSFILTSNYIFILSLSGYYASDILLDIIYIQRKIIVIIVLATSNLKYSEVTNMYMILFDRFPKDAGVRGDKLWRDRKAS